MLRLVKVIIKRTEDDDNNIMLDHDTDNNEINGEMIKEYKEEKEKEENSHHEKIAEIEKKIEEIKNPSATNTKRNEYHFVM